MEIERRSPSGERLYFLASLVDTESVFLAKPSRRKSANGWTWILTGRRRAGAGLRADEGGFTDGKRKRTTKGKLSYEKSKQNICGHPAGIGLLCVFTGSASVDAV